MLIQFLKVYSLLVNSVLNLTDDIRVKVFVFGVDLNSYRPHLDVFSAALTHIVHEVFLFKCWKN